MSLDASFLCPETLVTHQHSCELPTAFGHPTRVLACTAARTRPSLIYAFWFQSQILDRAGISTDGFSQLAVGWRSELLCQKEKLLFEEFKMTFFGGSQSCQSNMEVFLFIFFFKGRHHLFPFSCKNKKQPASVWAGASVNITTSLRKRGPVFKFEFGTTCSVLEPKGKENIL